MIKQLMKRIDITFYRYAKISKYTTRMFNKRDNERKPLRKKL